MQRFWNNKGYTCWSSRNNKEDSAAESGVKEESDKKWGGEGGVQTEWTGFDCDFKSIVPCIVMGKGGNRPIGALLNKVRSSAGTDQN